MFTEIGTWYWGIQLEYGTYGDTFWYCQDWSSENETVADPESSLTVNVLPLPSVISVLANPGHDPGREVNLAWEDADWDRGVLVVRREALAPGEPTQGQTYSPGDICGGGIVVYRGTDQSFLDRNMKGRTVYHYAIFNLNNSYYSASYRLQVETGVPAPLPTTFRFR